VARIGYHIFPTGLVPETPIGAHSLQRMTSALTISEQRMNNKYLNMGFNLWMRKLKNSKTVNGHTFNKQYENIKTKSSRKLVYSGTGKQR
jgi:hypothetical protein